MTKAFNELKTLFLAYFWSIFPNLGAKNFFPENPALSRTTSYALLAPCQNSEKTNDTIPRKRLDGRTKRPYFIGALRLPPWVDPINFWKKDILDIFSLCKSLVNDNDLYFDIFKVNFQFHFSCVCYSYHWFSLFQVSVIVLTFC